MSGVRIWRAKCAHRDVRLDVEARPVHDACTRVGCNPQWVAYDVTEHVVYRYIARDGHVVTETSSQELFLFWGVGPGDRKVAVTKRTLKAARRAATRKS